MELLFALRLRLTIFALLTGAALMLAWPASSTLAALLVALTAAGPWLPWTWSWLAGVVVAGLWTVTRLDAGAADLTTFGGAALLLLAAWTARQVILPAVGAHRMLRAQGALLSGSSAEHPVTGLPNLALARLSHRMLRASYVRRGTAGTLLGVTVLNHEPLAAMLEPGELDAAQRRLSDQLLTQLRASDWVFHVQEDRFLVYAETEPGHELALARRVAGQLHVPRLEICVQINPLAETASFEEAMDTLFASAPVTAELPANGSPPTVPPQP
ncbi:hypothetical protein LAJ19_17900 (plasmid) [Deinococcus taeanensis]|uniref:hypothetical protein n=1 Tax=Deinococcus taeanensis TaxID=2737050 RepID=UPI001CDCE643|nr:hypothetical protein [Deinococcus taeanensis]UBV45002.1 hypothetical protein LAJ19_17900 [Deinococcus taeanensis]